MHAGRIVIVESFEAKLLSVEGNLHGHCPTTMRQVGGSCMKPPMLLARTITSQQIVFLADDISLGTETLR